MRTAHRRFGGRASVRTAHPTVEHQPCARFRDIGQKCGLVQCQLRLRNTLRPLRLCGE